MIAPSPFRLAVKEKLATVLSGVEFTYRDEAAPRKVDGVYRGRLLFGSEVENQTIIIINEVPIPLETYDIPSGGKVSLSPWNLIIQGWTPEDGLNPTDPADYFLAAVKKALNAEEQKRHGRQAVGGILDMKGLVDKIHLGAGVCRPADEFSDIAYFYLELTLFIVEDMANPLLYLA